jgi:hypothetical protein
MVVLMVLSSVHPVNCPHEQFTQPVLVIGATGRPGAAVDCQPDGILLRCSHQYSTLPEPFDYAEPRLLTGTLYAPGSDRKVDMVALVLISVNTCRGWQSRWRLQNPGFFIASKNPADAP